MQMKNAVHHRACEKGNEKLMRMRENGAKASTMNTIIKINIVREEIEIIFIPKYKMLKEK